MKKLFSLFVIFILLIFLCACGADIKDEAGGIEKAENGSSNIDKAEDKSNSIDQTGDVVNITEKMFVTYINEIYVNTQDYIGKTIKIEGMYTAEEYNGNTYCYVYRKGPGCCGNDGSMCGFEFTYNGDMPEDNDWIEVIGTLRTYDEDGRTFLTLDAVKVTVMAKRGAETVVQ